MKSYPIIKIPYGLKNLKEQRPPLPQKPVAPKPPERQKNLPVAPTYEAPPVPQESKSDYGCFWYPTIGGIVLFLILGGSNDPDEYIFFIICSIIAAIIGIWALVKGSNENQDKQVKYIQAKNAYPKLEQLALLDHKTKLKKHNDELLKIESDYEERLDLFRNYEYPMYLAELDTYEKQIDRINASENIENFQLELRKKNFANAVKPSLHPTINEIKTGVSESFFLGYLKKYFGNKIYQNYALVKENISKPYLPDFTLYDREIGYCIDIEIDEPYIGKNGKPIHFVESEHDVKRDSFFNSKGWVVIRFAEKQVIEYPNECCWVILEVLNEICEGIANFEYNSDFLLPSIKQWTKDEAHEMAFKRIRNSYLKTEFIEKLNEEEHEISEHFILEIPKEKPEPIKVKNDSKKEEPRISPKYDFDDDLPF
ncbi:DUF559 domain-containing protein [Flavilitoribacter nigricans]|uniref:DUF559 domain-containing protein n=1 Tax=Flavilitoribacter nigricans (strain ATCC 23147 / DSM 23189 / NBRC 102662 / NCIMB 1420 / SS-2) TaxID=1122177 RepID=A0A2D0N607_FLAN2|nr:DUF559 domain-containing protein [Flavilitoribacter nigricans]PHN03877.1 hypothetical protein CRP01_23670 [Flavilitoribacter nigricans DSM 23189 = NBRC 102662]